ncbi:MULTISPECIES: HAD family hydrolase [Bacillaceae]|uniref:Phosphoserine phosphatase n=1 Tax=Oceanobacillus caeni TaxID=405946 RepID=A0ABR5MMY7_9BACI|nr:MULTISPECIES: HAD family hydrolase [Bacillaceae]KKE79745.1 haloacid dehalogenase [Bacilli bacterium VT-13-104]PZD89542.1 HAD family hydrolase [Bacilli bacterium]KPH78419.1 haloacid dehalogenase [Oceanobacillus caeni]MBU8789219.1 HAD family hydrolase [Oceanobacillus caeni]MED4474849.1 HAD family hydrolase [Oceanobacillus caeni]
MERIKAVFFDLDDTLLWDEESVRQAFRKTCELAQQKYNVDPEELEIAVRKKARELYENYEVYPFTQMIGINPFEGLWGTFHDKGEDFQKLSKVAPEYQRQAWTNGLFELGIDDVKFGAELAKAFPENRKQVPYLYEESLKVLDALKGDYKLLLLTNGSPELQNIKLEITPELRPYFDQIVISGDFGRGKPDPSIFEHALGLLNVKPEEVLMVGDNLNTDIKGANSAGIASAWINRKAMEATEVKPTYEMKSLVEVLDILKG